MLLSIMNILFINLRKLSTVWLRIPGKLVNMVLAIKVATEVGSLSVSNSMCLTKWSRITWQKNNSSKSKSGIQPKAFEFYRFDSDWGIHKCFDFIWSTPQAVIFFFAFENNNKICQFERGCPRQQNNSEGPFPSAVLVYLK
jgi:hypothetical protein